MITKLKSSKEGSTRCHGNTKEGSGISFCVHVERRAVLAMTLEFGPEGSIRSILGRGSKQCEGWSRKEYSEQRSSELFKL